MNVNDMPNFEESWKEVLVRFGVVADEGIADMLIRMSKQEEAKNLFHSTKTFLKTVRVWKEYVDKAKEEHEEDNEEYAFAFRAMDRYEKALSIMSSVMEHEEYAYILREFYEKKTPEDKLLEKLHIKRTCFYNRLRRATNLFSTVMWGAPSKDLEMALELSKKEVDDKKN